MLLTGLRIGFHEEAVMRAQPGGDQSVASARPFGPEGRQVAITELVLRHGTVSAR